MRYQKTAAMPPAPDLPELNAKEWVFVEAIGEGLDNCAAYRKAYGAEWYSNPALRVKACDKAGEPKIREWLRHLRAEGFERACQSLQQRIEDEMAFGARCEAAGNWGAASMTRDRCNKLMGLYIERQEIVVSSSPEQTLKELADLIGENPDKIEVRH
jgi:hypothetical protein